MTLDIGIVFTILVGAVILFATEAISIDMVALGIIVALAFSGVLTPTEAVGGFANPAVITIAALFVVSAGLVRTGALAFVAEKIIQLSGRSQVRILIISMITVGFISAFMNNTPVIVLFLPIALGIAHQLGVSPSKLLMPISFASIFGGSCTLIGTSTNIIVSSLSASHGFGELGMFEFTKLGMVLVVAGILYTILIGRRLIPERRTVTGILAGEGVREYMTELVLDKGTPIAGKLLRETFFSRYPDLRVLQIIRDDEIIWPPLQNVALKEGDILLVRGSASDIMSIQSQDGIGLFPELTTEAIRLGASHTALAEFVIMPNSELEKRTIKEIGFHERFGAVVVAIQRRGAHLREKIGRLRLRMGDVLLVLAGSEGVDRLRSTSDLALLEGTTKPVLEKRKAPIALAIIVAVVLFASLDFAPVLILAVAGAFLMVLTRCVSLVQAYQAINIPILVLLAGTISLGYAMEKTGGAELVATNLMDLMGQFGPLAQLAAMYALTVVLTAMMSNNATAVLMVPIAISSAVAAGLNPKAFIMAVAFGASASFATPVGYQTNALVYGPGGYRYLDFMKVGIPLNIVFLAISLAIIPMLWPLFP